jgi:hypothetical protein
MMEKLASAYDHLHAENEALIAELNTLRKSDAIDRKHTTKRESSDSRRSCHSNCEFGGASDFFPTGEPVEVNEYKAPAPVEVKEYKAPAGHTALSLPSGAVDDPPPAHLPPYHQVDVKNLSRHDRQIHEQYERLRRDSDTNHDDMLTAADVAHTASEFFPLLELEEATLALRHFMKHACGISEGEISLEVVNTPRYKDMLESATEREVLLAARSLGIPFRAFKAIVKLDTSLLEESQVLQDDVMTLSALHESLVREQERALDEKKESFTNLVETVSGIVICANAIQMGFHADSEDNIVWFAVEAAFTAYYICELAVKFISRGCTWYFFGSQWQWNLYDLVVVAVGAVDVVLDIPSQVASGGAHSVNSASYQNQLVKAFVVVARLARLLRLLRFKLFAELKAMVLGVFTGLKVLFWAVVLLGSFIYCVALFTRSTLSYQTDEYEYFDGFRSLPWSMFTLFRCFTDGCAAKNGTPLQVHLSERFGFGFMVAYVFIFLFVTIGIFNLIMANFVDYVSTANRRRSQEERGSNALEMQNQLKDLLIGLTFKAKVSHNRRSHVEQACHGFKAWFDRLLYPRTHFQSEARRKSRRLDLEVTNQFKDEVVTVRRHEFNQWLHDPKLMKCLGKLEINTSNKAELFDVLDSDGSGVLEFDEIIQGLMRMRGPPQKSDIISALLGVRHIVTEVGNIRDMLQKMLPLESAATPDDSVGNPKVKNPKVKKQKLDMQNNVHFPQAGAITKRPSVHANI